MINKIKFSKLNKNLKIRSLIVRFVKVLGILNNNKFKNNTFFLLKKRINIDNNIAIFKKFNFRNNIISKIKLLKNSNIIINVNSFLIKDYLKILDKELVYLIFKNQIYVKSTLLKFFDYDKLKLIQKLILLKKLRIILILKTTCNMFNLFKNFYKMLF